MAHKTCRPAGVFLGTPTAALPAFYEDLRIRHGQGKIHIGAYLSRFKTGLGWKGLIQDPRQSDAGSQGQWRLRRGLGCRIRLSAGSLSEPIDERGRRFMQIVKRMLLTIIINPSHQHFGVFASRHVTFWL